jgi:hypothetical protein
VISLIPSQGLVTSGGSPSVPPQTFQSSPYTIFLTPQQNLVFSASVNGNADLFLLTVSPSPMLDWISIHNVTAYAFNQTNLEAYLSANKAVVAYFRRGVTNQTVIEGYTPTTVTNVTIVFSNPGSRIANISFETTLSAQLAPTARVQALYLWTFSLGVLLLVPQSLAWWNRRRSKLVSTLDRASAANESDRDLSFFQRTNVSINRNVALAVGNYSG